MPHKRMLWISVLIVGVMLPVGCQRGNGGKAEPELPDWLTDGGGSTDAETEALLSRIEKAKLGLNLNAGDRFPLRKVVEQEMTQHPITGAPLVSRSRLELLFAITVADRQNDRTRLNVLYERVSYSHDVAGDRVEYDSSNPPREIPVSVRAYHDMVNDGFSFWIGPDNQIVEVLGFNQFLERCLKNVPEDQRQEVLLGIEAGSGESGIANFVDNSIGLLPYGKEQSPGDSWERTTHIGRPVPMHVNNTYTLKELTSDRAVVDIRGSIAPSTTMGAASSGNGIRVTVTGGEALGSCTIFRETGLPLESRVDRTVNMTVIMGGGHEFKQRKRVTTTIQAFPASGSDTPTVIGMNSPFSETGPVSRETSPPPLLAPPQVP